MNCRTIRHLAIHLMVASIVCPSIAEAQSGVRARDLGVPLEGTAGEYNAITDVSGVEVGHVTLISGSGRRIRGEGPIRTGVTAILPRGKANLDPVFAGWARINGNGEITGTEWIEESGYLNGPIMLTNSFSVGIVRDAVIEWQLDNAPDHYLALPVVGETSDRLLNDRSGFHVRKEHAFAAISAAHRERSSRAASAPARARCVTASRRGSGPPRVSSRRTTAGIPSGYWSNATTVLSASFGSPACPSAPT
jgi:hypothetical protein